jgi:hypothetical protein
VICEPVVFVEFKVDWSAHVRVVLHHE